MSLKEIEDGEDNQTYRKGLRFQRYAYNATTGVRKPHESTLCVLVTPDPVPQPAQMMHDVFTFEKMVKHMLGQFLH